MTSFHIISHIRSYLVASFLLSIGVLCVPLAILDLIKLHLSNKTQEKVFTKDKLSDAIFTRAWGIIGKTKQASTVEDPSKAIINQAYGVVLDLGPGTGLTTSYLDKSKITKVFGVEPNLAFHKDLKKAIDKSGLSDIYTIIGTGVEDKETLKKYGIEENSIDSVVACKVLCSIPEPKENVKRLYDVLAPGGQLLVYEHVRSTSWFTTKVQDLINQVWPFFFAGCNIGRPTDAYLYQAGDWEKKGLSWAEGVIGVEVITFIQGRLLKPKN